MNSQTTVIGRWAEMLENLETARKRVSVGLPLGAKPELGQFLTPNDVARFMAGMFRQEQDEVQILDPGAGIGSLTAALVATVAGRSRPVKSIRATLYEVDLHLADELRLTMEAGKDLCGESRIHFQYDIYAEDFIDAIASALVSPMTQPLTGDYDCVILNPPYRKLSSDTPTRRMLRQYTTAPRF
jgi:adenine-specific DNA-methyltransferase